MKQTGIEPAPSSFQSSPSTIDLLLLIIFIKKICPDSNQKNIDSKSIVLPDYTTNP